MKKYLLICLYFLFALTGNAQDSAQDSLSLQRQTAKELKKKKKAERNFHYNILGGPSYTPDFGVLIGGSALMTFRMDSKDTTMRRSVIPSSLAFMFNGGLNLVVKPQLFFKNDRFRIFGQFMFKNTQENFYGVGYETNKNYVRSDTTSQYRYSGIQINPWFLFRLGESDFFAGPQIDITYDHIMDPAKYLVEQPDYRFPADLRHTRRTGQPLQRTVFRPERTDVRKIPGKQFQLLPCGAGLPAIQTCGKTKSAGLDGAKQTFLRAQPAPEQVRTERYTLRPARLLHGTIP